MKAVIEHYLNVEESLQSVLQITKARWKKYELSGETIAHEDVENWVANLHQTKANSYDLCIPFYLLLYQRYDHQPL